MISVRNDQGNIRSNAKSIQAAYNDMSDELRKSNSIEGRRLQILKKESPLTHMAYEWIKSNSLNIFLLNLYH